MTSKFLIVEDHPIFAEALTSIIRGAMPAVHITHAHSFADAIRAITQDSAIDLILLDLWLPDTHGFEAMMELRRRLPKVPIVVVSAFADQSIVQRAIVCGASGFIPKSANRTSILQAIENILAGELAVPPDYVAIDQLGGHELDVLTRRLKSLTHQQLRVLQMLCHGLLNKQIAHQLEVNETTVKAHVSEILRKLSVGSRTQAVLEVSKLDFGAVLALYTGHEAPAPGRVMGLVRDLAGE